MLGSVTNGDCVGGMCCVEILKLIIILVLCCVLFILVSVLVSVSVPEGSHMGLIVQFLLLVGL